MQQLKAHVLGRFISARYLSKGGETANCLCSLHSYRGSLVLQLLKVC